jgi:outer membrane receptor protein involved in Fe transport
VAGARIDHNSRYEEVPVSPRVAVIFRDPCRDYTVKYIFSQAFVGPAPYFAYNVFDNGVALNTANPALDPETAASHEINVTWHGEKTLLGGSVYFNSQQNLFQLGDLLLPVNRLQDPVFVAPYGPGSRRILTQTANGGENDVFGFDLYGRYEADRLSLWTSYSFVDVENLVNGVQTGLPQISRHNVRAGFTWSICENLKLTPSVIYRSTPENLSNLAGLQGKVRDPYELNLYLLYTPLENVDVFAEFRNVTDHHYALRGILGPMPQETFRANGGVRWRF